jgi:hypothetical protein
MRALLTRSCAVGGVAAVVAWLCFGMGLAADPTKTGAPVPPPSAPAKGLVVHEWGTFTSFSGSDGVPAHFTPDNSDLPGFVYYQDGAEYEKGARLERDAIVSMETPVMYFYTDKEVRASIKVDFPKGWITEWYPFAVAPPSQKRKPNAPEGQSIRWDVKLLAGGTGNFAREEQKIHYYEARETDSVPVQAEVIVPKEQRDPAKRGGIVVQQEKFLFYRGVGNFPPPVTVQALGKGKVRYKNGSGARADGLVLVTVHEGKIGFKALDPLDAGAEGTATLPEADGKPAEIAKVMVKELTAAGLYEKEAQAMVKTWDQAWFGEEGTRLLYLVPRSRTDELLRLTIDPKPTDVVRVLVGRHDFLTPEKEADVERLVKKIRTSQDEQQAADRELTKLGRFSPQARALAEKRLDGKSVRK